MILLICRLSHHQYFHYHHFRLRDFVTDGFPLLSSQTKYHHSGKILGNHNNAVMKDRSCPSAILYRSVAEVQLPQPI